MGRGLGRATFKRGAVLLLRTCGGRGEAARQKEGVWSEEFWSLEVGP